MAAMERRATRIRSAPYYPGGLAVRHRSSGLPLRPWRWRFRPERRSWLPRPFEVRCLLLQTLIMHPAKRDEDALDEGEEAAHAVGGSTGSAIPRMTLISWQMVAATSGPSTALIRS